jgi:hypothetical protein
MGGFQPTPTATPFVLPRTSTQNLSILSDGTPQPYVSFTGPIDQALLPTVANPGIEINFGTGWIPADVLYYYGDAPSDCYADGFGEEDPVGKPWRLTSPASSWTIGGQPIYPQSGIVGTYGELAAKIADGKVLTPKPKRR